MNNKGHQNILSPALDAVSRLLKEEDVKGMIIGGIAASILGRPRFTNDIDLLILDLDKRIKEFIDKLEKFDIKPRILDVNEFALQSRVLLMRHQTSGINIDISMGILPFERDAVSRSQNLNIQGQDIILPTPEDLIVFKSISQRPIDKEDIKAIVGRNPGINKKQILSTVREFADLLEKKDIYQEIESILSKK